MFTQAFVTLALAGSVLGQMINTPASLIECQPAALQFSGGTPPYIIAALPGGMVSAPAIESINPDVSQSPYTWLVNLPAGTNITLRITDATGLIGYSAPSVVQAGASNACLNTTASTGGLPTGAVTTTMASASGTLSATTSAAPTTSTTSVNSMSASSAVSAASASSASASMSMSMSSSMSKASSAAPTSAASSASASAAATSKAGAFPTALAGIPALAVGVLGGLAVLL